MKFYDIKNNDYLNNNFVFVREFFSVNSIGRLENAVSS